jgi:hypothetical protein
LGFTTGLGLAVLLFSACPAEEKTPTESPTPEAPAAAPASPAPAAAPPPEAAPAPAPAPAGAAVLTPVALYGQSIEVPKSWKPSVRDESPLHQLTLQPVAAAACNLGVLEGHGSPEQAEKYLNQGAATYQGEVERAKDIEVGGVRFQGIHVRRPKRLSQNPDSGVDIFAAIVGPDLVGLGLTWMDGSPAGAEARTGCLRAFASFVASLKRSGPPAKAPPAPEAASETAPAAEAP